MKSKLIAVLFVMSLSVRAASAEKPFIDWTNLRNPPLLRVTLTVPAFRRMIFSI
jgi:hypothetical protein